MSQVDTSLAAAAYASRPGPADASAEASGHASPARVCDWCRGPIPERARRDSECCSVRCRQARHRFGVKAGRAIAASAIVPLRLAYADPPYPGLAGLYRDHPDYAGEVDHAELVERLAGYDGWALSTSERTLGAVLALCPPGVRVAAWLKGDRASRSWQPVSSWEPVIYSAARPVDPDAGRRPDSLVYGVCPMTVLPGRVIGAKPAAVCSWIFGLLGAAPGDELDDLYPGSGAVGRAWRFYTSAGGGSRGAPGRPVPSARAGADASGPAGGDA